MLKNIKLDSKELELINNIEKLTKVKCYPKERIDWKSKKLDKEKPTNAIFNIVIKNEKITEILIIGARIQIFPEFKDILNKLKMFYVIRSSLIKFPESLSYLKNLSQLDLSYNEIKEIPKFIENLTSLTKINIKNNSIKKIPDEIIKLPLLKTIIAQGNPIEKFPANYPNLDNLIKKYLQNGLNKLEAEVMTDLELIMGEEIKQVHHRGILNGYYLQNKSIVWLRLSSASLKTLPKNISNLKNLNFLNLSGEPAHEEEGIIGERNAIEYIPNTIGQLFKLKWLYLSKSKLKSIPREIGNLSNLQQLYISDNFLEEIPESLVNLKSLKYLDLQKNQLIEIPKWIGNLENLQYLNLGNNKFKTIIKELTILNNLNYLILNDNFIDNIAESIGELNQLQKLDLSNNTLTSESLIPLYKLKNLKYLNLSNNIDISYLSEDIGKLTRIEYLNINENQFISIPTSIWKLKNLKNLILRKNPWDDETLELINRDLQFILEYCRKKATIHIFFSHAIEDFERFKLQDLINFLEKQSEIYEILYCERDLTGNIDQFMHENIPKSNLLLFFATKKAVFNSDDCQTEIKLARENDIEIIPIRTDEVDWEDLSNVGLKRELGKDYDNNFDIFGDSLYDYIKNFKHNINLFEKEKAKIDKIKFKIKNEYERIINSTDVESYLKENYNNILEKIEDDENYKKNILDLFKKLMEIKEN